jgi:hypothetical protein
MKTQTNKIRTKLALLAALVCGLGSELPAAAASWVATGSLGTARYLHSATLLPDGKVLVAGGSVVAGVTSSVERYDPSSGTWSPAASMNFPRSFHTATLLPDGMVLITGGFNAGGSLKTAELYNPTLNTWSLTTAMSTNRSVHSATLLPNGKVLVAGGFAGSPPANPLNLAELYDPATGTWTSTGPMTTLRGYHKAALLPSGQVLIAGGADSAFNSISSGEVFTPATGQWTNTGVMKSARAGFAMLLLPNGKVLAAGGQYPQDVPLNTAELYDPAAGTWSWTAAMANTRADIAAILLPNGGALFVDGWDNSSDTPASELYNPAGETWSVAATFGNPRFHTTATLLANGKVLVAGGKNSYQSIFSTAQLYDTGSGSITPPSLTANRTSANTALRLTFNSRPGAVLSVTASDNMSVAPNAWPVIGIASETLPGQFHFTDAQATNTPKRFYRVRSP